jgi:hypothetical protein
MTSELSQLNDTELDAVHGGIFNLGNIVTQLNSSVQTPVAVNIGGGPTVAAAFAWQRNFSF